MSEPIKKVLCELTFTEVERTSPLHLHIRSVVNGKLYRVDGIPDPTQPPPTTEFEREIMKKMAADNELARTQYAIGEKRLEVFNPLSGEFRTSGKAEDGEVLSPHAIYRLAPKPEPRYEPLDEDGMIELFRTRRKLIREGVEYTPGALVFYPQAAPMLNLDHVSGSVTRHWNLRASSLLNEGWTYEDGTPVARKVE